MSSERPISTEPAIETAATERSRPARRVADLHMRRSTFLWWCFAILANLCYPQLWTTYSAALPDWLATLAYVGFNGLFQAQIAAASAWMVLGRGRAHLAWRLAALALATWPCFLAEELLPLSLAILGIQISVTILAVAAWTDLRSQSARYAAGVQPFRYSVKLLLIVTTIAAVLTASVMTLGEHSAALRALGDAWFTLLVVPPTLTVVTIAIFEWRPARLDGFAWSQIAAFASAAGVITVITSPGGEISMFVMYAVATLVLGMWLTVGGVLPRKVGPQASRLP